VRTTLTIDDDVAALLEKENRRAKEPMKHTVNRVLRTGLLQAAIPPPTTRFVVKPFEGFELPPQWTSGCVQDLLDILDGSDAR